MIKPRLFPVLAFLLANQSTAAEPGAEELRKLEELFAIPRWSLTTTLDAGAGYRDNVLLSPTQARGSGFVRGNLEAMLLRLPAAGVDGYAFLSLEETRYATATDHERMLFLLTEARWQPSATWKFGLPVQFYHADQVLDVSVTEAEFDTALLKLTGYTVAPVARWNFAPGWWAEAKGSGRQDHFKNDIDGYVESEGQLRVGRNWPLGSELSLAAASRWRDHDSRQQYTPGGRPITGTLLKFRQNALNARLELAVDKKKHWRVTLTALAEENRDNGSGYFDYNQRRLDAGLDWRQEQWEVRFFASVAHFGFPGQLVGIGIAPETRRKDDYQMSLEATRRLTASLALKVAYEWERSRSNDDHSRYRINTGSIGLRWSWDNLGAPDPTR